MKSYPKLFDEGRDALLDLVASGVEAYYRQRTSLEKTLPEVEPEEEAGEGDFLHDFVSLNVGYLNQLARIGSNYSILGARALERVYEWMQPPARDNQLSGKAGKEVAFTAFVHNPSGKKLTPKCEFRLFSNGRRLTLATAPEFDAPRSIEPGKSSELTLRFKIPRELKPRVDYQGVVIVTLGREKTDHLVVIRREP